MTRALASFLLSAVGACAGASFAQEGSSATAEARALVARCAAEGEGTGLTELESTCPGLGAALESAGLTAALLEDAVDVLDPDSLDALLKATRPAAQRGPDPAQLGFVMQGLRAAPEAESAWQRFKHWVERALLARRDAGASSWLARWLDRLTPGKLLLDGLVWLLIVAVIGTALFVILRELRANDVRWKRFLRREPPAAARGGAAGANAAPEDLPDWRRLEVTEQPAALFRAVARELSAAGRLPALGSHTHRELRQRARLEAADERDAWDALARAAERQIYAPRAASDDEARRAVDAAARVWAPRA